MTIGRCEIGNRRLLPLIAVQVLAMFFPFAVHFLSGGGIGFFHLWPFFVVVESAFLFYSADLIDGGLVDRYLLNLLIHFSLCLVVGGILSATTLGEYTFHDGSCIPMGGPWWLIFIMIQGLDYGILAIPLAFFRRLSVNSVASCCSFGGGWNQRVLPLTGCFFKAPRAPMTD